MVNTRTLPSPASNRGTFKMNAVTMRFVYPEVEAAFIRSRLEKLLLNIFRISAMAMLVNILFLVMSSPESLSEIELNLRMAFIVFFLAICMVSKWPNVEDYVGTRLCEGAVVMSMCMNLVVMAAPWVYWEEKMHVSVVFLALSLDTILTITHLMLPVRWSVLIVPDLMYVAGFSAHASGVLPWQQASRYVVTFACLTLGASWGLRSLEQSQRSLWALVIDERELRAKAEFAASTWEGRLQAASGGTGAGLGKLGIQGMPMPGHTGQSVSSQGSACETTDSGDLFRRLKFGASGTQLDVLHNLGEQEDWLIPNNQISVTSRCLGRGGSATVFEGSFNSTPTVAVKMFQGPRNDRAPIDETCLNELRFLRHLRHPNIVGFYGASMHPASGELVLVLERIAGKTLDRYIKGLRRRRDINEPDSRADFLDARQRAVVKGVMHGLIYLHTRTPVIVHADLKTTNVMVQDVNRQPCARLLDFGLSFAVTRNATLRATPNQDGGTQVRRRHMHMRVSRGLKERAEFCAPEVLLEESPRSRPSPAADIFSLGRLLVYVATFGEHYVLAPPDPDSPPRFPLQEEWRETIRGCTRDDPDHRPRTMEVYSSLRWDTGGQRSTLSGSSGSSSSSSKGASERQEEPRRKRRQPRLAVVGQMAL